MRLAGILLAAGSGSRFGGDKLMAALPQASHLAGAGTAIGVAAARHLAAGMRAWAAGTRRCAPDAAPLTQETIAIVRAGDAALASALATAAERVVPCARAGEGMGASLACGVAAAPDADGWLVALADMPWVAPATIAAVATALADGAGIVAPACGGRRGHPVGFAKRHGPALLALGADEGARRIVAGHGDEVTLVAVDDPGILEDVDVRSELTRRRR